MYFPTNEPENASHEDNSNCTFDYAGTATSTNYMYAIAIPINMLTLFGNGLILDTHRRLPKARAAAYYPIILLAAGDTCTGIAGPITLILYYVRKTIGDMEIIQIANYSVFIFAFMSATFALFALAYDRLVGTFWPLKHRVAMTRRRYMVMNILVWIPPLIIGFILPFLWHNTYDPSICYVDWGMLAVLKLEYLRYIICPIILLVYSVILFMYTLIFCRVRSHLHERKEIVAPTASRAEARRVHHVTKSEKKLRVTSLLILGTFSICWMPFIGVVLVQVYGSDSYRANLKLISLRSLFTVLALLNSTINPIIYGLRIPVFKEEAKRILCCCCGVKGSGIQAVSSISGYSVMSGKEVTSLSALNRQDTGQATRF